MNLIFNGKKTIAFDVLRLGLQPTGAVVVRKRGGWTDNSVFQNLVKKGWLELRMSGPRGGSRYFTTDAGKAAMQAQALTRALVLAITAPTQEKSKRCVEIAAQFAQGLSDATVEQCKADALAERDR